MINLESYSPGNFDRGASKCIEGVWWGVKLIFFLPALPWPSTLRVWWLRRFGATVGRGVVIRGSVNITFPWRLVLGDHVWIGEEVLILSLAKVQIGNHVCLSQRVFLCTGSHNYRNPEFSLVTQPITINDGCWIGAQSFIAPGVTFGRNTVCAAGSVVVKPAGPNELIGGNPAKFIRFLEEPR